MVGNWNWLSLVSKWEFSQSSLLYFQLKSSQLAEKCNFLNRFRVMSKSKKKFQHIFSFDQLIKLPSKKLTLWFPAISVKKTSIFNLFLWKLISAVEISNKKLETFRQKIGRESRKLSTWLKFPNILLNIYYLIFHYQGHLTQTWKCDLISI